jgi:transposase
MRRVVEKLSLGGAGGWTPTVIPTASGVRVSIATGHTDMRRGMNSPALLVQEAFRRDPHGGDLYVFHGKSGKLIKILWHDGLGMSPYAKRLQRGRFLWPSSADGVVTITPAQLGYLLEGIDWRRENLIRQATALHGERLPMMLPGISISTKPDDYAAFKTLRIAVFGGNSRTLADEPIKAD